MSSKLFCDKMFLMENKISIFYQKINKMPEELKAFILSGDMGVIIYDAGINNGLTEGQISQIGEYVRKILFNEIPLEDLQIKLELDIGLKTDIAENITKELNDKMFNTAKRYIGKEKSPTPETEPIEPTTRKGSVDDIKEIKKPPKSIPTTGSNDKYREFFE